MPVPVKTPYGPRETVAAWLTANDIDPSDVPWEGPITIEAGQIRYVALLCNEAGRKYVDEATGDVAQEERTTPLKVPPVGLAIDGA
ncbi:hypothetical protein [Streptomyces sp. NPDC088794]|uniref:hypothetical protein n=1 Tax=Streptomyces sp. NPDC088794 TaxID=3365902 RepID=UPI003810901F